MIGTRSRVFALTVALASGVLVTSQLASPRAAQAAEPAVAPVLSVPITGTSERGPFTGAFGVDRFEVVGDQLVAVGPLTGTLLDATTGVLTPVTQTVALPVHGAPETSTSASPALRSPNPAAALSCSVLHLNLAPLDLNLLGLTVHLNQVVLDIAAQPGGGALLGNLLCAVASLLDITSIVGIVAQLLNQILAILATLP